MIIIISKFSNFWFYSQLLLKTTRRNKRIQRKVLVVVAQIRATYNNTLIHIGTLQGNTLFWSSSGARGFQGARKKTPFAAKIAAHIAAKKCIDKERNEVRIYICGPGLGRETAIRGLYEIGIRITLIRDITSVPHNGCRLQKRRRVLT